MKTYSEVSMKTYSEVLNAMDNESESDVEPSSASEYQEERTEHESSGSISERRCLGVNELTKTNLKNVIDNIVTKCTVISNQINCSSQFVPGVFVNG